MNLASIALKNLRRHRLRNLLTIVAVAVTLVTFVLLRSVLSAWSVGAKYAAQDRIATRNKVSFVMWIPTRYVHEVRTIPGVVAATWMTWFGAHLPDAEDEFFANWACDPESMLEVYDDMLLPEAQKRAFLQNRQGAIVGQNLAHKFNWKVGDRVVLEGSLVPGRWELRVEGIYTAAGRSIGERNLFFHWRYMNERLPASVRDQAGYIVSRVERAELTAGVVKQIDAKFDSADTQTLSMSERALQVSFLGMMATLLRVVDAVSWLVLAIMVMILGNTIAMSVRERTREYAVFRAIGGSPKHILWLVGMEAIAIGVLGGLVGLSVTVPLINRALGPFIEQTYTSWFPYFRLEWRDGLVASVLLLGATLLAAALPALRASRMVVVDALRKGG